VLDDGATTGAAAVVRDHAPPAGALVVRLLAPPPPAAAPAAGAAPPPPPAWLASLELLDTAVVAADSAGAGRRWRPPGGPQRGRAARVRTPVAALPDGARLSDLLLVRPGDYGPAPALALVADSASGAAVVRAGDQFGLFWEQYAAPAAPAAGPTTADSIAVTATRLDVSAWERLGALVGRAVIERPVSLRYADPVPAGAGPGRYVTLRWPVVPPGTYRLDVVVTSPTAGAAPGTTAAAAGGAARSATTSRVVRVVK
jgi:hypothetical protein